MRAPTCQTKESAKNARETRGVLRVPRTAENVEAGKFQNQDLNQRQLVDGLVSWHDIFNFLRPKTKDSHSFAFIHFSEPVMKVCRIQ